MAQHWLDAFPDAYHFDRCPSTQSFLLDLKRPRVFCRANVQSAGRGQRGRPWHSPRGQLSFSFSYLFPGDAALHRGLAQWTALTLLQVLRPLRPEALWQLKWPNDVYVQGKKVAGILIDGLQQREALQVVVGIGLNLFSQDGLQGLDAPQQDADSVLNAIMPPLLQAYAQWTERPYFPGLADWQKYDMFFQKSIQLEDGQSGTALGIDQKGRLILKNAAGLHYLEQGRICIF